MGKLTGWLAMRDLNVAVTYILKVCVQPKCVFPGKPSVLIEMARSPDQHVE